MSVTLVQANGLAQTSAGGPGSLSVSMEFESDNTADNAIVVFAFFSSTTWAPELSGSTCTDTQGNTYRQVFYNYGGYSTLIAYGFFATGIAGGSNRVTFATTADGSTQAALGIIIAEYSGLTAPTVNDAVGTVFGGNPTVLSLHAHYGSIVTGSFAFSSGDTNKGAYAIDITDGVSDVRVYAAFETSLTGITDSIYGAASLEFTSSGEMPGYAGSAYLQLWDNSPWTVLPPSNLVTMPAVPVPRSIEIAPVYLSAANTNPFNGQQQTQDWQAQYLEGSCLYPPLAQTEAQILISFLESLDGTNKIFQFPSGLSGMFPESLETAVSGGTPLYWRLKPPAEPLWKIRPAAPGGTPQGVYDIAFEFRQAQ